MRTNTQTGNSFPNNTSNLQKKKKSLSQNIKIHHYQKVLKPVVLYASEKKFPTTDKGLVEKLEKCVKSFQGFLGQNTHQRRPNIEVYSNIQKITETISNRQALFYGQLKKQEQVITPEDAFDRGMSSRERLVASCIHREEQPARRCGAPWTEEQKKTHSQKMKEFWTQKKNKFIAKINRM